MANKNISWVEPNHIYSENRRLYENGLDTNQDIIYETTPPMENFCVAVDLEVEIMKRGKGGVVEPAKTILVSWNSPSKDKGSISFFEGTKYTFGDKKINYLTTSPSTFGTYEDVIKEGTNECFGINSIDIQYNSYMVPEVTIEFTDIRGISLFAPEELRHSETNEEGVGGMYAENSNIAGSFFKCFFSFPYPRFKLMVKGFYGEPTTYELTVADFRTRFDCTTGNFNATAKFVGYAYSLLNDITMNALVVAPLSEYIGKSYWKNSNFLFEDGTPMLTISEVITRVSKFKDNLERLNNESVEAQASRQLAIENDNITKILSLHDDFVQTLVKYFASLKLFGENNPVVNNDNRSLVLFLRSENFKNVKVEDEIKTKYNLLKSEITKYGNHLNGCLYYGEKGEVSFTHQKYIDSVEKIKNIKPDYVSLLEKEISFTEKIDDLYVIIYDGSKLNNQIKAIKDRVNNSINENSKRISEIEKETIIKTLGFNPTVENVTKMVFAHFETLMHCMYNCIKLINNRNASSIGISTTDVSDETSVGPFPRIDIKAIHNGIESIEEGWLGDLPGGVGEQEVQLIEGLLKGVDEFQRVAEIASQNLLSSGNTVDYTTSMEIPVIPLDIIMKTNPYGDNIDFNNISDFIGKVGLRMLSVLSTHKGVVKNDYTKMGKADAYNFYKQFQNVGKKFLDRLCGSDDVITTNMMMDCLTDNKDEEKLYGKWAWDSSNSESTYMIHNSKLALYDKSNNNGTKTKILPFTNLNWDEINDTVRVNNPPINMDYFITTKYIDGISCKNIFKIDLNYDYGGFLSKMQVDNEQFKYVDELKLQFEPNEYLKQFYYDDKRYFAKKLSNSDGEINFNPYEKSHFLPSKRPFTEEEAINSTSFNGGSGIDDNFKTIRCIIEGDNSKEVTRNDGSFSSASNEMNNNGFDINTFTVPFFKGYTSNMTFTDKWSLFGQEEYYDLESNEAKALVFLDSLKMKEEGINGGGIRFDNYCADGDKNITAHILNEDEPFCVMSYCGILLLGGYFWREKEIKGGNDPIASFIHKDRRMKSECAVSYDINSKLFTLRQEIKDILIEEFISWISDDNFGFKRFQSAFELNSNGKLKQKEFVVNLIHYLKGEKTIEDISSLEHFLWKYASNTIYENYLSLKYSEGNIKLFNRENSAVIATFTNFYLRPCMIIKPTSFIYSDTTYEISTNGNGVTYLNGFISKLKELYKKNYENAKAEPVIVNPIKTSNHIKTSLYKYLKILYDKWLSGTKEEDWNLINFYEKHWYFLDSFYNKVGDRIMINMVKFCNDVIYSQKENGYSLLSFISKAYAVNRFNLHCVQNFMDLKNEQQDEKFHKMFKAIPYNEIDFNNINFHPAFILMYTYEYSSKLDIKGADYKNDSFNLDDDDNNLPVQITSKRLENGFRIPAFAVTYGKQYQHYFKNIDVSTDNPIVTEEAIKAQFMIASMNSKNNGENGKKLNFLGQDLYTVYSNNSYTCTVKMMGCAWIQPLMYFQLNNIPMFRGAYLIQKVSHHIEPGNMETTFVGTRMAKTTTKIVDEAVFGMNNDQTAPQVREIVENTLAEVKNDCEYAFYNPNIDLEDVSMPSEDLNLTLAEYETKYNSTFNSVVTNKDKTVKQFLADILNGEAGNQDELGRKLVAVVLFNRYMHFGKNLTKMFWDHQHELNGNGTTEDVGFIEEIFTKSPSVLEGQMTKICRNIAIFNDGIETPNMTQPVKLTMHMLKSMDGYCTTRGYDVKGGHDVIKEPIGWWHEKAEYLCQHDGGGSNNEWGHVFVAGAWKKGQEHWQEIEGKVPKSEDSNPSEKAQSLYNSISRTVKASNAINCQELSMEITSDKDTFFIIAKPEEKMIDVFDAIVNTYYDYFSECNWIVNNDGKENPIKIRVKTNGNKESTKKNICIAKMKNDIDINPLNTHEELNNFFYITLKKKYGVINTNNKETFKMDCPNFNKLATNDVNWVNVINNLLNNKIEPCGGEVNLPIVDGYQWDGSEHLQNKNKPTTPFPKSNTMSRSIGYDYLAAADEAKKRAKSSSIGACARYVREAMQEAGAGPMNDRPHSACAYSKFMEFWGFTKIYEGFGPSTEGYTPQKGDIAVIAGTNSKKHGHIHIYNDGKWYSDFGANTVYCYKDKGRPYIVYRWIDDNVSNT